MITKKYSAKNKYLDKVIPLKEIKWLNRGNLLIRSAHEQASKERQRDVYFVLGFKQLMKKTKENINYEYEPIPLKLQKNCRAFLRGTERKIRMNGLRKIIFSK